MKNYIQKGDSITVAAPTAIQSGQGVLIGELFGVAASAAAVGDDVALSTVGVFEIPKTPADDVAVGDAIYWDASADEATTNNTDTMKIGVAVSAAGVSGLTARVRLNGPF